MYALSNGEIAPAVISRLLGHQVLERALLYEMPPESAGQEETLCRVRNSLRWRLSAKEWNGGVTINLNSRSPKWPTER